MTAAKLVSTSRASRGNASRVNASRGNAVPKPEAASNGKAIAPELPLCVTCLQQAETCREQARDAARLKRFRAAFGLFLTAAALCRHVFSAGEADEPTKTLASERLHQIDIEMATYTELARAVSIKN